jgi:hypothetical protein
MGAFWGTKSKYSPIALRSGVCAVSRHSIPFSPPFRAYDLDREVIRANRDSYGQGYTGADFSE